MFTPSSKIGFVFNVKNERDYQHTYSFENEQEQRAFFDSKTVNVFIGSDNVGTPNEGITMNGGSVKIAVPVHKLLNCSYMHYEDDLSKKRFYCFVDSIKYVNTEVTEVSFTIDLIQSYYFDHHFNTSYIERQHVSDDTVGQHVLNEGLEIGDYLTTAEKSIVESNYLIVVAMTEDFTYSGQTSVPPQIVGGTAINYYQRWYQYSEQGLNNLKAFLDAVANGGKSSAIISIFVHPITLGSDVFSGGGIQTNYITIPPITTHNNYLPKNNKVLTHPYVCLAVESPQVGNVYKYEDLDSDTFTIKGTFGESSVIACYPNSYQGNVDSMTQIISASGFPQLPWNNDYYANWSAQNKNSRNTQKNNNLLSTALGVGSIVGGVLASPVTGGVSAVAGVTSGVSLLSNSHQKAATMSAQEKDAQVIPDTFSGSTSASDVIFSLRKIGFYFKCKSIRSDMLEKIDNYFTMYGYKVNSLEVPNIRSRRYWNYIKCATCTLYASINHEHLQALKNIYENGVTFWHDDDIGNYDRNNEVRQ